MTRLRLKAGEVTLTATPEQVRELMRAWPGLTMDAFVYRPAAPPPRPAKASSQQIQTITDMVAQRVLDLYDPHTYEGGDDLDDED